MSWSGQVLPLGASVVLLGLCAILAFDYLLMRHNRQRWSRLGRHRHKPKTLSLPNPENGLIIIMLLGAMVSSLIRYFSAF